MSAFANTWSTGIVETDIKTEIEDKFNIVTENLKYDASKTACAIPAVSSDDSKSQSPDDGSESPPVLVTQSTEDTQLSLLCRLCANPKKSLTDIFDFDATNRNIPSMIHLCLPIMVKKTDALPRQVCRSCLEELERCYRFHQTVAQAEEQLLAFTRPGSCDLEQMKETLKAFSQCDREDESIEYDSIDGTLKAPYDIEIGSDTSTSSPESAPTVNTTIERNVSLSSLRPCLIGLSIAETGLKDNSEANSEERNPSNSKPRNPDLTTEAFDLGTTTVSGIVQQVTCDSRVTGSSRCSAADVEMHGNGAKHKVDKGVQRWSHTVEKHHKCSTCAKMFQTKHELTKHSVIHACVRVLHKCDLCSKTFVSRKGLSLHLDSHSSSRKLYKCNSCSKVLATKNSLSVHLKLHSDSRKLYRCDLCSKMFLSKDGLSGHLKSHSSTREHYTCVLCLKMFLSKPGLSGHLESHYTTREPYRCDLCSIAFKSKYSLYRHRKFHTGGLHSCDYCGKQFTQKSHRDRHHLVHTGERPHKCSKCEKAFTQSSSLKKHTATVH